jgi:hypothetical protein
MNLAHIKQQTGNSLIRNLDNATRKYTAFRSFSEMALSALKSGYRPTLYVFCAREPAERKALKFIADYYDRAMSAMHQDRRAYRC